MYLWVIAAVTAYFIKGLCGFANTLVLTSILSFGAANANISPIDLLLGYPANLILTWNNRRRLDPKVSSSVQADVIAGLVALGYSERDAAAAARNIPPDATAAEGIRIALRYRN